MGAALRLACLLLFSLLAANYAVAAPAKECKCAAVDPNDYSCLLGRLFEVLSQIVKAPKNNKCPQIHIVTTNGCNGKSSPVVIHQCSKEKAHENSDEKSESNIAPCAGENKNSTQSKTTAVESKLSLEESSEENLNDEEITNNSLKSTTTNTPSSKESAIFDFKSVTAPSSANQDERESNSQESSEEILSDEESSSIPPPTSSNAPSNEELESESVTSPSSAKQENHNSTQPKAAADINDESESSSEESLEATYSEEVASTPAPTSTNEPSSKKVEPEFATFDLVSATPLSSANDSDTEEYNSPSKSSEENGDNVLGGGHQTSTPVSQIANQETTPKNFSSESLNSEESGVNTDDSEEIDENATTTINPTIETTTEECIDESSSSSSKESQEDKSIVQDSTTNSQTMEKTTERPNAESFSSSLSESDENPDILLKDLNASTGSSVDNENVSSVERTTEEHHDESLSPSSEESVSNPSSIETTTDECSDESSSFSEESDKDLKSTVESVASPTADTLTKDRTTEAATNMETETKNQSGKPSIPSSEESDENSSESPSKEIGEINTTKKYLNAKEEELSDESSSSLSEENSKYLTEKPNFPIAESLMKSEEASTTNNPINTEKDASDESSGSSSEEGDAHSIHDSENSSSPAAENLDENENRITTIYPESAEVTTEECSDESSSYSSEEKFEGSDNILGQGATLKANSTDAPIESENEGTTQRPNEDYSEKPDESSGILNNSTNSPNPESGESDSSEDSGDELSAEEDPQKQTQKQDKKTEENWDQTLQSPHNANQTNKSSLNPEKFEESEECKCDSNPEFVVQQCDDDLVIKHVGYNENGNRRTTDLCSSEQKPSKDKEDGTSSECNNSHTIFIPIIKFNGPPSMSVDDFRNYLFNMFSCPKKKKASSKGLF